MSTPQIEDPTADVGRHQYYAHVTITVDGKFHKAVRMQQQEFYQNVKRAGIESQEDWRAWIFSKGGPIPSRMGRVFVSLAFGYAYVYWSDNKSTRL